MCEKKKVKRERASLVGVSRWLATMSKRRSSRKEKPGCVGEKERDHREEGVQRDGHGVRYQGTVPLGLSLPQHTQEADERDEKKMTER